MLSFPSDTTLTCSRNTFSEVTFYDSSNVVNRIDQNFNTCFPFRYIENNRIAEAKSIEILTGHLKEGADLPVQPFHHDWMIVLVLFAGFLYSIIRSFSKSLLPGLSRFFLFREAGQVTSREIGEIYYWQSTIINLISFINIALFAYCAASYYELVPSGISGFTSWLIAFGIIILAVTFRHLVCLAAGRISSQGNAFGEYLMTVYLSYHYMAIALFIIVILLAYSKIFHPGALITAGFIIAGLFYFIRIVRLMLIFIKRSISIFYLILYLCALEFLPVLVVLKYSTGLF